MARVEESIAGVGDEKLVLGRAYAILPRAPRHGRLQNLGCRWGAGRATKG